MVKELDSSDEIADTEPATISINNIGGINQCEVEFTPGVTILQGRNATNRTSLLRALNGILGGTAATVKSDANKGEITLTIGDEKYSQTYTRTGNSITTDGETYTDNETLVDLFITLLEGNPARRAVERGDDLRDVIMRPVDTDAIEQRIRDLKREKKDIEAELDRVEKRYEKLPNLEEQKQTIKSNISEIDEEIEIAREEVEDFEADSETAEEAEKLVEELDSRRQELSKTEDEIDLVNSELQALREDLNDTRTEHEEIPENIEDKINDIEDQLATHRDKKRVLDDKIASLTTIVEFNEDILSEKGDTLPGVEPDNEAVTAELAPDEDQEVVCWTCGSRVDQGTIMDRLKDLREIIQENRSQQSDIEERIETLEEERRTLNQHETRRQKLERKIENIERKIAEREEKLEQLDDKSDKLDSKVQELEIEVSETESLRESDLLEKYEQLSELQYERGQLEQQLSDIKDQISDIEALPEKSNLKSQRDELKTEIENEQNRIANIEREAIEAFNEHMDEILDVLDYKNIARVWIERKQTEQQSETMFDLHIVREDETGTVYEDVIEHLSESEREVVGLVVALAGYLAHEAYEKIPFMLLDSIESIDSDRIAALVSYFANYAPYLVVALLPDDARALSDEYDQITSDALTV